MNLGVARTAQSRLVRARAGTKRDARACWYRVAKAKAAGAYVVRIEGDIGVDRDDEGNLVGLSATTFINKLRAIRDLKSLLVHINSRGGSVVDGMQIFTYLRSLSKAGVRVTVRIGALAASMASVIAMAGDVVEIHPQSILMIHSPWVEIEGNAADLRKQAAVLDKLGSSMMTAYKTKNHSISDADLQAAMQAETHYTGAEAVEAGFADVLLTDELPADAVAYAGAVVKAMARPKRGARAEGDDENQDDKDANGEGDENQDDENKNEDDANGEGDAPDADLSSIAAALGAIAETLQEVLDAVTGSDEPDGDEMEPEGADDEGDDENPDDEEDDGEEKPAARASQRRRVNGKARDKRSPVNTGSKAYAALKKIAKTNGQLGSFVTYVAAGASLKQLQDRFLDGEPEASTRIRSTAAAGRSAVKATKLDADSYYATLNGAGGKKKDA